MPHNWYQKKGKWWGDKVVGSGDKAVGRQQRGLRCVTKMAHFLASSNAVSLAAEESGEFWDEGGGRTHADIGRSLGLNYKVGS